MPILDAPGKALDARAKALDAFGFIASLCPPLHQDGPTPHGRVLVPIEQIAGQPIGEKRIRARWSTTGVGPQVLGVTSGINKLYFAPDVVLAQIPSGGGFAIESWLDFPGTGGTNSHSTTNHYDNTTTPVDRLRAQGAGEGRLHLAGVTGAAAQGCFGWGEFYLHYPSEGQAPWDVGENCLLSIPGSIDADQRTTDPFGGADRVVLDGVITAVDVQTIPTVIHVLEMDFSGSTIEVADNFLPNPGFVRALGTWEYDSSSTDMTVNPGAGIFRVNDSLNQVAVSKTDQGSVDRSAPLLESHTTTGGARVLFTFDDGEFGGTISAITNFANHVRYSLGALTLPGALVDSDICSLFRVTDPATRTWIVAPPRGDSEGGTALDLYPRTTQGSPAIGIDPVLPELLANYQGWDGAFKCRFRVDNLPSVPSVGQSITICR